jgi:hypothetical protein
MSAVALAGFAAITADLVAREVQEELEQGADACGRGEVASHLTGMRARLRVAIWVTALFACYGSSTSRPTTGSRRSVFPVDSRGYG